MYIIMYKYSALKINRKSFPNNIKNPIALAQRKQSPPSSVIPGSTGDLPNRASQRHPNQHPRQRRRKRHKMAQCNRMVLLHQQRPNNLRPHRRMLLRSCKKELPRQTHQNRLLRQRPRLGRKLLHPPPLPLPRSPHRELLHGQPF